MNQADKVKQLHKEGMKPNTIAQTIGISRASVYRCLNESVTVT
ncbi:helix-turn-helix domain-containing protein [Paracoccus haematequi]